MANKYRFVRSPNIYPRRNRPVTRIGIHCTQTGEETAPGVANYFKRQSSKASAHFVIDTDEIIQCVSVFHTAWAMPHVNADGIHLEFCGYAGWSRAQWLKKADQTLTWGAALTAELIHGMRYMGSPFEIRELRDREVKDYRGHGLIRHSTASRLLKPNAGHTDPGDGFPMDVFLERVKWWMPFIEHIRYQ